MPPLAKFAASPFGVVERLAEPGGVALMPVTVRNVEPALRVQALTPGKVSDLNPQTDARNHRVVPQGARYDNSYTVDAQAGRARREGPAAEGHRQGRHATACRRACCRCWTARPA